MKEIPLTHGKFAKVSDHRFDYLSQWKWHCVNGYAVRSQTIPGTGKQKAVFMHREIVNAPAETEVDHLDGDGLNNTDENLRICTRAQNQHNRKKYSNNTSGYKGVIPHGKRWLAYIRNSGVRMHIGVFDTPEQAAGAYDSKAKELFGKFAKTNF